MTKEIDAVVAEVRKAGGEIRASVLIKQMESHGAPRRSVQRAIQAALDKGQIRLGQKMVLELPAAQGRRAA
ncbi:MarR family transcriptional regulator [Sinorhizobium meliloti]|uniref:MarR family transcriptional regulator n=1 Tax=Rhizobium meliloti TaxID=382 RepID=UPI000FD950CE|nr:MarR family transcriptional regulator [Sinorhizobium meliloti]RVE89245.1 MarR family transcriptional regulator [Sinorhizobium meliloti]RVH36387.1 MarR family transcriptional regulator [Sinorhizobium meliloti]RVI94536.1 MarR family transcriptional regulator [Sinorhizobium meliloti]RVK05324.1 MarR family transcriptional regulator [Sinorhizobium meliloti]